MPLYSEYTVIAGAHDIQRPRRQGAPKEYQVYAGYRHPHYLHGPGQFPNDIFILQLKTPVELNEYTKIIPVNFDANAFDQHSECYITGWGFVLNGNWLMSPNILQEAQTQVIGNSMCNRYVPELPNPRMNKNMSGYRMNPLTFP